MRAFSLTDLSRTSNVLSMMRLPLAALFPYALPTSSKALTVIFAAGLTDVLDGWVARRTHAETPLGAIIDPIADKVFALSVISSLLARRRLPPWAVLALLAREILEAPLVAWVLVRARAPGAQREAARANIPGKIATIAQFVSALSAIVAPRVLKPALAASAAAGVLSGITYWRREL